MDHGVWCCVSDQHLEPWGLVELLSIKIVAAAGELRRLLKSSLGCHWYTHEERAIRGYALVYSTVHATVQ